MERRLFACVLALLASTSLRAQTGAQVRPLGPERSVSVGETEDHHLVSADVAVLGQREFLVTWDLAYQRYSGSHLVDWGSAISGRKVSLLGQPAGEELALEPFEQRSYQGLHRLAADAAGRFATLWQELDSADLLLRLFAPSGSPLTTQRLEPYPGPVPYPGLHPVAMDRSGRLAAAWTRVEERDRPQDLWLQLFDVTAEPAGDSFQVPVADFGTGQPAVAMANGTAFVVSHGPYRNDSSILTIQRFDAAGRRIGRRVPVAGTNRGQGQPAIAANPEGRFVVAWKDNVGIGARLFDASARPVGPLIRVAADRFAGPPDVAMDALGSFVVVWEVVTTTEAPYTLKALPFNCEGVPQGREAIVSSSFRSQYFSGLPPAAALTDAGTFLIAWAADSVEATGEEFLPGTIQSRAYALLRDDDRCVWRNGVLRCDTARDGALHQELPFGVIGGDRLLLADFDGDGRDNPCVRRGNTFRCTDGQGHTLQLPRFGHSVQIPLAGDLDGDGDDDPCVRRGRSFLCDTAHDGGAPEADIPLGIGTDEPLLGDVDGDGDDDPCIWRISTATFLCDADHDGTPDLAHTLLEAQRGDRPLLGDLDGDGPADFCLGRSQHLLCDLDRDGVLTEEVFATRAGDLVLLGNVDGV